MEPGKSPTSLSTNDSHDNLDYDAAWKEYASKSVSTEPQMATQQYKRSSQREELRPRLAQDRSRSRSREKIQDSRKFNIKSSRESFDKSSKRNGRLDEENVNFAHRESSDDEEQNIHSHDKRDQAFDSSHRSTFARFHNDSSQFDYAHLLPPPPPKYLRRHSKFMIQYPIPNPEYIDFYSYFHSNQSNPYDTVESNQNQRLSWGQLQQSEQQSLQHQLRRQSQQDYPNLRQANSNRQGYDNNFTFRPTNTNLSYQTLKNHYEKSFLWNHLEHGFVAVILGLPASGKSSLLTRLFTDVDYVNHHQQQPFHRHHHQHNPIETGKLRNKFNVVFWFGSKPNNSEQNGIDVIEGENYFPEITIDIFASILDWLEHSYVPQLNAQNKQKRQILFVLDDQSFNLPLLECYNKFIQAFVYRRHISNDKLQISWLIVTQKITGVIPTRIRSCITNVILFRSTPYQIKFLLNESFPVCKMSKFLESCHKIWDQSPHSFVYTTSYPSYKALIDFESTMLL